MCSQMPHKVKVMTHKHTCVDARHVWTLIMAGRRESERCGIVVKTSTPTEIVETFTESCMTRGINVESTQACANVSELKRVSSSLGMVSMTSMPVCANAVRTDVLSS